MMVAASHRKRARTGWGGPALRCLLAIVVCLVMTTTAKARPAAPPPPSEQQARLLKQRDRLYRLADDLGRANKQDEGIALVRRGLAIERDVLGEPSAPGLRWLKILAGYLEGRERFPEAEAMRQERLTVLRRHHGEADWRVVDARLERAQTQRVARLSKAQRGQLVEANQLNTQAHALWKKGQAEQALPLATRAWKMYRELFGERHPATIHALNAVGVQYYRLGRYREALPWCEQALKLTEQVQGLSHPSRIERLNNLAALHARLGKPRLALPLYQEALHRSKEVHGEEDAGYGITLNNLAMLYLDLAEYRLALSTCEKALRLSRELRGEKHEEYPRRLDNLAQVYQRMGEYDLALSHREKALQLIREIHGERHSSYPYVLTGLAQLHANRGEHRRAVQRYQQAVRQTESRLGKKHPAHAAALNGLGLVYHEMGEHRLALTFVQQAFALRKDVLGATHPAAINSLNSLGLIFTARGEHRRALALFQEAVKHLEQEKADRTPPYATVLNNLASVLEGMGEKRQALALYRRAYLLRKEVLGERHPEVAISLHNLAVVHRGLKEYREALPLLEQALRHSTEVLGQRHPHTQACVHNLTVIDDEMGLAGRALPLMGRALAQARQYLDEVAAVQSERQQLEAFHRLRTRLDWLLLLTALRHAPASTAYDEVLAFKGAILVRQRLRRLLDGEKDGTVRGLLEECQAVTRRLVTLALQTPTPITQQARHAELTQLSVRKDDLEAELSQRSETFRLQRRRVRSADVQRVLPVGTALVDCFVYTGRLTAFVVRRDRPVVRLELGRMAPIEKAITTWRQRLGEAEGERAGQVLRRLLWLPLLPHLERTRVVLISPDGPLTGLPFPALPGNKAGTYLVEERAIACLPVPQLLEELLAVPVPGASTLLAVGDIDFDARPGAKGAGGRGIPPSAERRWNPLPGSRSERDTITGLFTRRFPTARVTRLGGSEANRATVSASLGQHSHIHLATHGFFAPSHLRSALSGSTTADARTDFFGQEGISGWHPALLSGLVFAGANRTHGEDSGILTALEVGGLDLRGCRLVTLSACETGQGRVAGGEGMLGLQRAFQAAGARTTVASLWSVHDAATSVLMEQFYARLWGKEKVSTLEALHQAQRFVLNNPGRVTDRARRLRDELVRRGVSEEDLARRGLGRQAVTLPAGSRRSPLVWWAAFVLAGDWR